MFGPYSDVDIIVLTASDVSMGATVTGSAKPPSTSSVESSLSVAAAAPRRAVLRCWFGPRVNVVPLYDQNATSSVTAPFSSTPPATAAYWPPCTAAPAASLREND